MWTPLSQCTQLKAKRKLQKVKVPRRGVLKTKSAKSAESVTAADVSDAFHQDSDLQSSSCISEDSPCTKSIEVKQLVLEFSTGSPQLPSPEVLRTVSLLTLPYDPSSIFDINTNENINICEL